jgi:CRISPR-associated protein Cmr4
MYKKASPLFIICETPLHAGSGSDLGIVDLPIQRERHTSFPKIEGSSLKGALREAFENKINSKKTFNHLDDDDVKIHRVFGYDSGSLNGKEEEQLKSCFKKKDKEEYDIEFAGCLGISDARLFLFPVKSVKGVFAWITCPKVLYQFEMDMKVMGNSFEIKNIPSFSEDNSCLVSPDCDLLIGKNIILEEYTFVKKDKPFISIKDSKNENGCSLGQWLLNNKIADSNTYWQEKFQKSIVILSDDDFKDFVNLSTEVITRNKINNITGTAADTGLFTEEYLPSESIMYSMILSAPEFKKEGMSEEDVSSFFEKSLPAVMQIGGSASLGKGVVRTQFLT